MEMLVAAIAHSFAFSHREYQLMPSSRLPLYSAIRDVVGFNDLLLEARYTLRGTDFRLFNDQSGGNDRRDESGVNDARIPLLGGRSSDGTGQNTTGNNRLVRAYTGLQFGDLLDDPDLEEMFESARQFKDGDYNYRVIDS
jgi:hypothetical protein